ncbi:MAG: insulinase family protein [Bacteroidales bacterium]|jgi:predicted Zn-dependent peptidase|nr:insulinase family protein [Bacteroidales bacterium]
MINYQTFTIANGLQCIVNTDTTTPFVAMNILYKVGSKNENPERTGFAHLFEHLMFGGSKHIPDFDGALQRVGGENNAFTNTDITNYYITLPKENIETAFWLESDRMMELDFSQHSLDIQKNVVIEEFKQRYLNRPYGDAHLYLRPLAYKVHPYQWATIGKNIEHIEQATLDNVRDFFYNHYAPNNAILTLSGNISVEEVMALTNKWFAQIPKRDVMYKEIAQEPPQTEKRTQSVEREVPSNALYKAFHIPNRLHPDYYAADMLSDVLSNGKSARLYTQLVQAKKLFSEINAYITGEDHAGLLIICGNLMPNVSMETAETAIYEELHKLQNTPLSTYELQKITNKIESHIIFNETGILNKAMNLAKFAQLGNVELINSEIINYQQISAPDLQRVAIEIFRETNDSTLYYYSHSKI